MYERSSHIHSSIGATILILVCEDSGIECASCLIRQESDEHLDDVGLHVVGSGAIEKCLYMTKILADTLSTEVVAIQVDKKGGKMHISADHLYDNDIEVIATLIRNALKDGK